jgi:hypothetical protein
MSRIRMLQKSKKVKGRTALYCDMDFLEKLEALAAEREMSLNMFALSLLEFGVEELEAEAGGGPVKKKRKAK